jgi:hypothetical protein
MKNLSIFAMLTVLFLYSCKENPNMVPQANTPSSPATLTAIYAQHMGKQWLLGGRHMYVVSTNSGGGWPYDTSYRFLKDTVSTVSVVSDRIISFMGNNYRYVDTPIYKWLITVNPDTSERLLFYCDNLPIQCFSYINYYYKKDSFQYYIRCGDIYSAGETVYYSK